MAEIQRPGALYQQVAAAIREAIRSGEFEPGAPLPSETQLIARYGVSRPTIRNAIAALRTEGLIDVHHGKGSFVRASLAGPATTVERTVTSNGDRYTLGLPDWTETEPPSVYRTKADTDSARDLRLPEGEALFGADWLLTDPASGARALRTVLIPFATAEGTPLADDPGQAPAALYAALSAAGHELTWRETVRARMPRPDEHAALQLPDATPVLHSRRVTQDAADGTPLILEVLTLSAAAAELAFHVTAETGRALRSVPR